MKFQERITFEESYNEMLEYSNRVCKEYDKRKESLVNQYETTKKEILNKCYRKIRNIRICYIVSVIASTILLGTFVFTFIGNSTEQELAPVSGDRNDIVCYVTDTGECYHDESCGYLKSKKRTTIGQAERAGYRPCSRCSDLLYYTYISVKKENYFLRYTVSLIVSLIVLYIIYRQIYNKTETECENDINYISKQYSARIQTISRKNLALFKRYGDFLSKAKLCSEVPFDVEYINGLPQTVDNRYQVYKTLYGKCYHKTMTCNGHSMSFRMHAFEAKKGLRRCPFCFPDGGILIPEWHKKYIELENNYNHIKDDLYFSL